MAEKVVRIRVLAVADPSLKSAFVPFEEAARKAKAKADRTMGQPGRVNNQAGYRTNASISADERAHERSEVRKRQITEREQRYVDRMKETSALRVKYAETIHSNRERERAARESARGGRFGDGARALGRGALRMGTAGIGAVGDMARGAGIDFNAGTLMSKFITAEQAIIRATNSGMAARGKVASKSDIKASSQAVDVAATETRRSRGEAAMALEAFVSKSSDINLGQAVLKDIGKIANATGSDFTELATSAGILASTMGNVPNKADAVTRALRIMAKQGAMGTVEVKDLATYMPRLAATANMFGGKYEDNLATLGAIAQMALKGGASTAAEATHSASSFSRDLLKKTTAKKFEAAGIDLFVDQAGKKRGADDALKGDGLLTENTQLRSAEDILIDVLKETKGNQLKIAQLVPNAVSNRVIRASSKTFLEAEKVKAGSGEAAVREEFAKFRAVISGDEINQMSANYEDSVGGKAQMIQNRAEGVFSGGFTGFMDKVATNPNEIMSLVTDVLSSPAAIGAIIMGAAGGAGASEAMAIATMTVATMTVTSMLLDKQFENASKGENAAIAAGHELNTLSIQAAKAETPEEIQSQIAALQEAKAKIDTGLAAAESERNQKIGVGSMAGGMFGRIAGFMLGPKDNEIEEGQRNSDKAASDIAALQAKLDGQLKEGGSVKISNISELGAIIQKAAASVDPDARDK